MSSSLNKLTWQDIESLLDELLDLSVEARQTRLSELEVSAPDYAEAARKALDAASTDGILDAGLDSVAGDLLRDLLNKETSSTIGSELSVYRLDEVIGRGGMGVVYRASRIDGQFDQQVAIKKIPFGLAGERGIARFQEERTILASVRHPFVGQLLDGGLDEEGLPYLVMELVDGGVAIDRYVAEQNSDESTTLGLFQQICNAVAFLHQNLVTHGDIKPSNILVRPDGHVKLIDFGIARLATSAEADSVKPMVLLGATPGFSSPEQILGNPITTQSDVYALGATLETLLLTNQPELALLNADISAIVEKCKSELPDNRYSSVDALADDLKAYLEIRPVTARIGGIGYRAKKYLRRNWFAVSAVTALSITLLSGVAFSTYQARIANLEAHRATVVSEFLVSIFERSGATLVTDSIPTLRELVEAADDRVKLELEETPAIKAELQEILGSAYSALLKDSAKARVHFRDVLDYIRATDSLNTAKILALLNEISVTHLAEGNYQVANTVIDEAIALDMRDGQPDMVGWLTKAHVAAEVGTIQERLHALDMAEKVYVQKFGPDSQEIAWIFSARAQAAIAQGNDVLGLKLLREAVTISERNGSGDWVVTERMRNNLATSLHRTGKYSEAAQVLEQVIANIANHYGPNHSELIAMLNNIGALYNDLGNTDKGLEHLRRGFRIAQNEQDQSGYQGLATELNYARTLILTGGAKDALPLLIDLEHRATESVGVNHVLTAVIQRDRAWAMLDLGEVVLARQLLDVARPKLSRPEHSSVAARIDAEIALAEKNYQRAETAASQALLDQAKTDVTRPWMQAEVRLLRDKILMTLGQPIDTEQHEQSKQLVLNNVSENHRARRLAQ